MSAASPTHRDASAGHPRPALRNSNSLLNARRKNLHSDDAGPSGSMSEPPASPHQAYFDKYPKRADRTSDRDKDGSKDTKHVTIEFPTIPERKPTSSRHGGLRDWRAVQAHLEPRVAPRNPRRKDKEREKDKEKIRDPDDMVIVSLAGSPSPTSLSPALPTDEHTSEDRTPPASAPRPSSYAWPSREDPSHQRPTTAPTYSSTPPNSAPSFYHPVGPTYASAHRAVPSSPSLASGFRSSLISSPGTLTSSSATDASTLTPPRTPTSAHEPVVIASSSVEAMDALIEGMGSGLSTPSLDNIPFLSPSFARSSRFGYPLYQPPLPTPPEGIKLGIVNAKEEPWRLRREGKNGRDPASSREGSREREKGTDVEQAWGRAREEYDREQQDEYDTETETDSSPFPPRRTPTTSTSTFASSSALEHGGAKSALGRNSSSSASSVPRADSAPPSRTGTPPAARRSAMSSAAPGAPPIRIRSDEEIEAEERADVTSPLVPPVRVRQRSGLSVRSGASGRSSRGMGSGRTISTGSTGSSVHKARAVSGLARSPGMWDLAQPTDLIETDDDMDVIIRNHVSRSGEEKPRRSVVPSIDDIIRAHAPAVVAANQAASKRGAGSRNASPSIPGTPVAAAQGVSPAGSSLSVGTATGASTPPTPTPGHSRAVSQEAGIDGAIRSSIDSIADEAQRALQALQEHETPPPLVRRASVGKASSVGANTPRLQHARSFPKARASSVQGEMASSLSPYLHTPFSDGASICSGNSGNTVMLTPSLARVASTSGAADNALEMAQYLRSPRLTRLLTLRRPANAGLTVSLADVGSLTGRPVIVYLGLGCVRYLVALYDEMAEALNLRLICVDRWGLGRTTDVPTERRGLLEWASVVEEVADTLGLGRYSVLAHSAGAPYALASSLKAGERVFGSVHLLAPWVSMAVDGGYKWLKYVPNGLIKTAQAAEWRLQGWMIGKPPTIQYEGIGFDATAPMALDAIPSGRPSFSSFSEYDELDDFDGRFASRSTLPNAEEEKRSKENEARMASKSEGVEGRPRKASKSIFGGLFHNTLPKSAPKRGMSTPPSAITTQAKGAFSPAPPPPVPPIPPTPAPPSPTTPTPGSRPPKLKGLRSMSSLKAASTKSEPARKHSAKEKNVGLGLGMEAGADGEDNTARTQAWASEFGESEKAAKPRRERRSLSLTARPPTVGPLLMTPPVSAMPTSPRSPSTTKTVTLASALLQASHAESLKGGTADLLSILERDSKPWGFSYADVRQPVRVWYGDRDDKIGVGSVRWMERVMKACEVKIVKGAGHSLMTHAEVVVEVLESIAREWDSE